jgi:hypothetical protein
MTSFLGIASQYWILLAGILAAVVLLSNTLGIICGSLAPLLPPTSRWGRWARAGARAFNDIAGAVRELQALEAKLDPEIAVLTEETTLPSASTLAGQLAAPPPLPSATSMRATDPEGPARRPPAS